MRLPSRFAGLPARLLLLTILFVMLAEVLVFAPSVARFRLDYLRQKLAEAHLAALAVEATPQRMLSPELERKLLGGVGAHSIDLIYPSAQVNMLSAPDAPPVDAEYDLREASFFPLIGQAFAALPREENRVLRVVGPSPHYPMSLVDVVLDEQPMIREMRAFGWRVLGLSLVISILTAGLVYLALTWLMVGPMRRIVRDMIAFRADPESFDPNQSASGRQDEIGLAQRELTAMQRQVQAALRQKAHLAALGAAVAKINHDLRNMLSTASLLSERLTASNDPQVKSVALRLFAAIDRAATLCAQTLSYTRDGELPLKRSPVELRPLLDEVGAELLAGGEERTWRNAAPDGLTVLADRDQLYRAISNVARNAFEAGAGTITVEAGAEDGRIAVTLRDDGPGLPPRARENLFHPFAGSGRSGSTGLGLPIAREILRAHGGDLKLVDSTAAGAAFRAELPGSGAER